ncbi:hypothetical protein AYI70_g3538 [Smittium culicis]|uniref:Uncharacterized protein n=1 Tax=Smittium culicis TaxID=133412 RepID=A0A1R1Y2Z7_9FUNG|nr:hypothetical protein AYI70_g3538 [Smittium culicis]
MTIRFAPSVSTGHPQGSCFHRSSDTIRRFWDLVPPCFLMYSIEVLLSECTKTLLPCICGSFSAYRITNSSFTFIASGICCGFHGPE